MPTKLITRTLLSILIFFSISFITVLFHINSPFHRMHNNGLKIGFPFEYYQQFMVDCPIPNSSWNLNNLIMDCGITWGMTMLFIMFMNNKNKV